MDKFEIIKQYIDDFDYENLLKMGAPSNEFDSYSRIFAEKLDKNDSVEDIAQYMAETMDKAFVNDINPEKFIETAEKIKKVLNENA